METKELTEKIFEVSAEIAKLKEDQHNLHCRLDELKKILDGQNKLTESVYTLANEMTHMREEMSKLDTRLAGVENRPVKRWETVVSSALTALIGGIIGFFMSNLF